MKSASLRELASLKKYFLRYKAAYVLGFCSLLLTSIFTLLIPWVLKRAIDGIKAGIDPVTLLRYAGLMVLFALIEGFFRFWMRNILIGTSRKVEYLLRNDFFAHLQTLPLAFFQQNRTGDLMSLATNDLNAVRNLIGPGIMYFVNTLVLFPLDLGFMLATNRRLTLSLIIFFPPISFLVMKLSRKLHVRFKKVQEQFSTINTQIQENFAGIRVVQAYTREEFMAREFQRSNDTYLKENMGLAKIAGVFLPMMSFLTGFFLLMILWIGGGQVIRGQLSIGGLAAFVGYLGLLLWPAVALGWVINLFQRGTVSLGRINDVLRTRSDIHDAPAKDGPDLFLRGEIEMEHVDFAYTPGNAKALSDITLRIRPGESIGLVGRTGSGKSTLANLIPRLYEATAGEIRIDGVAIRQIPLKQLRKNIGYVPQETFIFSESIGRNIGFSLAGENMDQRKDNGQNDGNNEDTMDQIREAAFFAHLLDDIEGFTDKFETMVGERGVTLSGGQKQRMAISRALIRKPPILIFDDVFASVDLQTEYQILQKIHQITEGRTCLIIAHRLSAVRDCNRIYVLDQGRIVESGTHRELINLNGFYAQNYQKQLLSQELEGEG
jgi:ATP-binding cassette subfamily B multidrug efflux pump